MLHKGSGRIRKAARNTEKLLAQLERGIQENMDIVESHEASILQFELAAQNLRAAQTRLIEQNRAADNLRLKLRTFTGFES